MSPREGHQKKRRKKNSNENTRSLQHQEKEKTDHSLKLEQSCVSQNLTITLPNLNQFNQGLPDKS